jgi:hypothetical protein
MRRLAPALALALGACTLLTRFDEEGQPCDAQAPVGLQCLAGFACQAGLCRRPGADGGLTAADAGPSTDAGLPDGGP